MTYISMKSVINLVKLTIITLMLGVSVGAQVTIGEGVPAHEFSVLELSTKNTKGGIRLPHLTTVTRDSLTAAVSFSNARTGLARGLAIYNTTTNSINYWNGTKWVNLSQGQAEIVFIDDETQLVGDPTIPSFSASGSTGRIYIPRDTPNCTTQNPAYNFLVVTGGEYTSVNVINASTGRFTVSMAPNATATQRTAIIRVVNNCTGEYRELLFTQLGNSVGCGTTTVPSIQSPGGSLICQNGALYLNLQGLPSSGVFIWTLNGVEVGRGNSYMATQPGRYVVYGDKIGCSNSSEFTCTINTTQAPSPPGIIVVGNNGIACGADVEIDLIIPNPPSGTITWYRNGVRASGKTGSRITAGPGNWFAVVENGSCSSTASSVVTVIENLSGNVIPAPRMRINGNAPGVGLCTGGSMYLQVVSPDADVSYTWYLDNTVIGTGNQIYYPVPSSSSAVVRLRATGSGCPSEALSVETISGQAPTPPFITVNTNDVLCGGTATLTAASSGGSAPYRWYRNGIEIPGQTAAVLQISQVGSYTVSDFNGICASLRSSPKVITISDFATLSWINHPTEVNAGDTKTYSVSINFPQSATYNWTVTNGTIMNGQGASSVSVRFPTTGAASVRCDATNACGNATNFLQESFTVTNACDNAQITGQSTATNNLKVGESVNMTINASGTNVSYQWYSGTVGSGTVIPGQTTAIYSYSASTVGTFRFYCIATASGDLCSVNPATSQQFTVNVTVHPEVAFTRGAATIGGRSCFDVAFANDGTGGCANLTLRAGNKADFTNRTEQDQTRDGFTATSSGVQVYTFLPVSPVSNVRYDLIDPRGVVESITPNGYTGNNISSAKFTVTFKNDLNTTARNVLRTNALEADLYIIYNDAAAGGGSDRYVKRTIHIQDCMCCGAAIGSLPRYYNMMCHNLGADTNLDPFTYVNNGDTVDNDIKGSLYEWGRPTDGHQLRNSTSTTTLATSNTPGHNQFIYNAAGNGDWRQGGGNDTRWGDATQNLNPLKATNDPCPKGFEVPSDAQWTGIRSAANTWTFTGNGYKVGNYLYLPQAGRRLYHTGTILASNAFYWSSTVNTATSFNTDEKNQGSSQRAYGLSVRCIEE